MSESPPGTTSFGLGASRPSHLRSLVHYLKKAEWVTLANWFPRGQRAWLADAGQDLVGQSSLLDRAHEVAAGPECAFPKTIRIGVHNLRVYRLVLSRSRAPAWLLSQNSPRHHFVRPGGFYR